MFYFRNKKIFLLFVDKKNDLRLKIFQHPCEL